MRGLVIEGRTVRGQPRNLSRLIETPGPFQKTILPKKDGFLILKYLEPISSQK